MAGGVSLASCCCYIVVMAVSMVLQASLGSCARGVVELDTLTFDKVRQLNAVAQATCYEIGVGVNLHFMGGVSVAETQTSVHSTYVELVFSEFRVSELYRTIVRIFLFEPIQKLTLFSELFSFITNHSV